jgi:hypothetical protein
VASLFTSPRRWKRYDPPKRWCPTTSLRGVINQNDMKDISGGSIQMCVCVCVYVCMCIYVCIHMFVCVCIYKFSSLSAEGK